MADEAGDMNGPDGPLGETDGEIEEGMRERAALRESLAARDMPTDAQLYDVREATLWENRYLPVGSVVVFVHFDRETGLGYGEVALLIVESECNNEGFLLATRVVGAEDGGHRAGLHKEQRKGNIMVHVCMQTWGPFTSSVSIGSHAASSRLYG